jgi:HTH-type transcriptional regulator, glycine betaine synthesis regulator
LFVRFNGKQPRAAALCDSPPFFCAVTSPVGEATENVEFLGSKMNSDGSNTADCAPILSEIEIDTIELFVRAARLIGLSKSIGEIYGLLFVSVVPMPFEEIRTRLNMSSGSASQGLRLLRSVGAVRVIYVPGDRRDHFAAETCLQKIAAGFLREKIAPNLSSQAERLQRLTQLLADIPYANRPVLEERLGVLEEWRRQANAVVPLVMQSLEPEHPHE